MTSPIGPQDPGVSVCTIGASTIVTPDPQASGAGWAAVSGSEIEATSLTTIAYTIANITNTIQWRVEGANAANFSDATIVQAAADVAASASANYTVSPAPYRYYRVMILDKVGGTHGTATVHGIGKAY